VSLDSLAASDAVADRSSEQKTKYWLGSGAGSQLMLERLEQFWN